MAKNLSARKKDQVSLRNNIRNRNYKSTVKTLMKQVLIEIDTANLETNDEIYKSLSKFYSKIDKAIKRGVISKNSGARKKSLIAGKIKNIRTM